MAEKAVAFQLAPEMAVQADNNVTCWAVTHPGLLRLENEDSYCVEKQSIAQSSATRYLAAVADGLGGHRGGEVASRIALDEVRAEFQSWGDRPPDRFVTGAVQQANMRVFDAAHESADLCNMQTTLTMAVLDGKHLSVAHVGDCRLYRFRKNGMELLTRDHTMAMDMLRLRMISPEQSAEHPGRHQLTRSVGADLFLRIDTVREQILAGDSYLLCTDGLWGQVEQDDIRKALQNGQPEAACQELLNLALERGGPDNITIIVFRVDSVVNGSPISSRWHIPFRR
jgi:protein phosphatase